MKKSVASKSSTIECWVPLCKEPINKENKLLPLPSNSQSREIWLALAGKPVTTPGQKINFCSNHFSPDEVVGFGQDNTINNLPLKNIPEKICHLCLSIIDSNKSSNETVHVLSKYISTEMPACMEELLPYFSPSNSEPLHKILSLCIPDLDIQCNPPPLVCNSCFENIWLFHIYKVSALEVEEALKADIPVEHYSKMVLCRSCPVRSGTNFVVVEEESTKGQLLKKILSRSSTEKSPLPLRLCTKCFEVVTRLDLFYRSCQTAQKKMNAHTEMEKRLAQRRNKLDEFIKMSIIRKQDICMFFVDSSKNLEDDSQGPTKLSKNAKATDVNNEKKAIINSVERGIKKFCKSKDTAKVFFNILQQLSNTKDSEYCTETLNKWHQMKSTALTNQKKGKLTELDKMTLNLVEYEQRKEKDKNEPTNSTDVIASSDPSDDPNSTDGFGSSKTDSSDSEVESTSTSQCSSTPEVESSVGKNVESKHIRKHEGKNWQLRLLTAVEREFDTIQKEKTLVKHVMDEIFARLVKKEYCKYTECDLKRKWSNMVTLAYSHKKTNLTDQDKRLFQLKQIVAEYRKNRTFLFYPSHFKTSLTNKENKIVESLQSTSQEVTNTRNRNSSSEPHQTRTLDQTATTGGRWKGDREELFNSVEQEYNEILRNKGIVPSKCWTMIISTIFKKKLFKSYNEIELYMLWQKIRRQAFKHESKGMMTTLDKKVMAFLERHKKMEDEEHSEYLVESHLRKEASDSGNESTSTNSSVPAKCLKTNREVIDNQKEKQLETRTKDSAEKSHHKDVDNDEITVSSKPKTLENNNKDDNSDSDATAIDEDENFVNSSEHISWSELNVQTKKGPLFQNKIRKK